MISTNELKERKKELKLTYAEISKLSNIPQRTVEDVFRGTVEDVFRGTVEDVFRGRSKAPRIDTMEAIAKALDMSLSDKNTPIKPETIVYGEILTNKEKELLRAYRSLPNDIQKNIFDLIKAYNR